MQNEEALILRSHQDAQAKKKEREEVATVQVKESVASTARSTRNGAGPARKQGQG